MSFTLTWLVLQSILLCTLAGICDFGSARFRLSNVTTGFLTTAGDHYSTNTNCTWFIESQNSSGYVNLKFNLFDTECLWDYLHIFNGASIYTTKLAAYSGNIIDTNSIDSGSGSGDIQYLYRGNEIFLTSSSPRMLLHFFSDLGATGKGFNISYWVSTCIANCSSNGECDEENGECLCSLGWSGDYCQYPSCPSNCNGHGNCIDGFCQCAAGYTGYDCSILISYARWSVVNASNIDPAVLSHAGSSSVLWAGFMWVFGGYQFGVETSDIIGSGFASGSGSSGSTGQLLRYHLKDQYWEVLESVGGDWPSPRYAHSAVVYENSMYIYGGALLPSEQITDELWKFSFDNLSWTQIQEHRNESVYYPIGVKYHTAHVVNGKMVVLLGYSAIDRLLNYVQEFDLTIETWLPPPSQYGVLPPGLMAHASVYIPDLQLIFIYGGIEIQDSNNNKKVSYLFVYQPTLRYWKPLTGSNFNQAFHTLVSMGGALVAFGGLSDADCFSDEVLFYDIILNKWRLLGGVPGYRGNIGRYGHSAVPVSEQTMLVFGGFKGQTYHELLQFTKGNCSSLQSNVSCLSSVCSWTDSYCTDITLDASRSNFSSCHLHVTCSTCSNVTNCHWTSASCVYNSTIQNSSSCPPAMDTPCSHSNCLACISNQECGWSNNGCQLKTNTTLSTCFIPSICSAQTTCSTCRSTSGCLWCPSLSRCVRSNLYSVSFPFGQCLGWVDNCHGDSCSNHQTCDICQKEPGCGWCTDPSDTGLGVCGEGGFLSSLNGSFCPDVHWYFDTCPSCQCNGHSTCINESTCLKCRDHTRGPNCESCELGYFGYPLNGQQCSECYCNEYNTVCNTTHGNCTCLDVGVTGPHCTSCRKIAGYVGSAFNFCYYPMTVGFIYTFGTSTVDDKQSFFVTAPPSGDKLNFKLEITRNPESATIVLQFFLGRMSQSYLTLYNLSEPINMTQNDVYSTTFSSFSSSSDAFFTFSRSSVQSSKLFNSTVENFTSNYYTNSLWDGDVGLVIYVYNLKPSLSYKITIDQTDLLFLVYFFATFLTCFTLLLSLFLLGWYIKRKLEVRAFIRAQHIELQRRVRRPFARIKAIIEKSPLIRQKQHASYVAVETVRDTKAAILTLMIRLPVDGKTGHPRPNQTGICFGSTFVKMNTSKSKDRKRQYLTNS